jgi:hypothetical protein
MLAFEMIILGGVETAFADSIYSFTTIDVPGANGITAASGINDSGQIVGYFRDDVAAPRFHGFLDTGSNPEEYPMNQSEQSGSRFGASSAVRRTFSAILLPSSGSKLADGDLVILDAVPSTGTVPGPGTGFLLTTVLVALLGISRRRYIREILGKLHRQMKRSIPAVALPLVQVIGCSLLVSPAHAAATVSLGGSTAPSFGTMGSHVNVTVRSGWPSVNTAPGNIVVSWAATCGGAAVATTTANSLRTFIGASELVDVTIPSSLATNTYFVSLSDSAARDRNFTSSSCSEIHVTGVDPFTASCVPSGSLGVVAPLTGPAQVYAYVPNGAWDEPGATGLKIVQVETGGGAPVSPVAVSTGTDAINSCAGNPLTGEAVCTANSAHVLHIGPPPSNTVTTLTSGADASASFYPAYSCVNCGVAINALNNQAIITEGFNPSTSGSAMQVLNLATDTFSPPLALANQISENIQVDPADSVIVSANQASIFDVVSFDTTGALTAEYAMPITPSLNLASTAIDCATRIALAPRESSQTVETAGTLVLADLTQAQYTAGSPGSWTAPYSETTIIGAYSVGLSGVIAPGANHPGVVRGTYGWLVGQPAGSSFAVLQLPATSGTGTPALADYAYVPCVDGDTASNDNPHTFTAYVSPNDGKSYGLFVTFCYGFNNCGPNLLKVDLAGILALNRTADGHTVVVDDTGCLNPTGTIGSTVLANIPSVPGDAPARGWGGRLQR